MPHEGDPKSKRHRIESLESELARYDWIKGESLLKGKCAFGQFLLCFGD
jgi:hypothetical protein